jgi:AcrR family transcriptional regulator
MKTWNTPQQARSRERFNHILDHAEALFARQGYEVTTTNHIAEASQVAIGSLYHFFPDKEAVLGALVERYVEELRTIFPQELAEEIDLYAVADRVVDQVLRFAQTHIAFAHLLFAMDPQRYAPILDVIHQTVIEGIERVIDRAYPTMPRPLRYRYAMVSFYVVKGLLPLMSREGEEAAMIVEVKTALRAYLQAFLVREGYAT